jgi:hypothetical protein
MKEGRVHHQRGSGDGAFNAALEEAVENGEVFLVGAESEFVDAETFKLAVDLLLPAARFGEVGGADAGVGGIHLDLAAGLWILEADVADGGQGELGGIAHLDGDEVVLAIDDAEVVAEVFLEEKVGDEENEGTFPHGVFEEVNGSG